jgi:alkylation response protein AidB-like acyl-CoA dehydrogenase
LSDNYADAKLSEIYEPNNEFQRKLIYSKEIRPRAGHEGPDGE